MLSLSGKALVICHPKQTCEGSPGKAKPADLILPWHTLRGKPPFREILHYVQNDTCHVEHKRNIPWKGKTYGVYVTMICTPR